VKISFSKQEPTFVVFHKKNAGSHINLVYHQFL